MVGWVVELTVLSVTVDSVAVVVTVGVVSVTVVSVVVVGPAAQYNMFQIMFSKNIGLKA